MDERKFSESAPGTLRSLLADAYSRAPELVRRFGPEWEKFDAFVYAHLPVMDRCGFVSVEAGEPIGFISWDPRGLPDSVEIGHNCIVRAFQGRGRGKLQLLAGLGRMRELQPRRILVRTGAGVFFAPARKMYRSAGFRRTRTIRGEDDLIPERVQYELDLGRTPRGRRRRT